MTLFLLILLGFIIYFVLQPILRVWLAYRRAKKQANEFFNGTRQQHSEGYRQQSSWPRPRRKKIDPNVGEYVEFEEIRTYTEAEQSDETKTVKYETEDQVVDVEWEDVR